MLNSVRYPGLSVHFLWVCLLIAVLHPCASFTANQCPEPPLVPDADLDLDTSGMIKPGHMASYTCHSGTLVGASYIVCTSDGTWSAPAPRCEG